MVDRVWQGEGLEWFLLDFFFCFHFLVSNHNCVTCLLSEEKEDVTKARLRLSSGSSPFITPWFFSQPAHMEKVNKNWKGFAGRN